MKILKLPHRATVEDLLALDEKAELVNGQIVLMGGDGFDHNRPKQLVWMSLYSHEMKRGGGYAIGDGGVFLVQLPHRESFSPDVAWSEQRNTGPAFHGAPALAVEIRSPGDYGLRAEPGRQARRVLHGGNFGGVGRGRAAGRADPRISCNGPGEPDSLPTRRDRRGGAGGAGVAL
jgi:hypothetical protein